MTGFKKIAAYGAALIAVYLVVAHPAGSKGVTGSFFGGSSKLVKAFQGPTPGPGA